MTLHTALDTRLAGSLGVVFYRQPPGELCFPLLFILKAALSRPLADFFSVKETKSMVKQHILTGMFAQPRSLFLSECVIFWRSSQKVWLQIMGKNML